MSDSVNCQFYTKIGACRHGEKCSRRHIRPTRSRTIMMANMYENPEAERVVSKTTGENGESAETTETRQVEPRLAKAEIEALFNAFYKDVFIESALTGGYVEDMVVCENHNDHLNGNVYVKFQTEEAAQKARDNFSSRWYNGRPVYCELSPVSDFRDSSCRQHDTQTCDRGGTCNFMHVKRPSRELLKQLRLSQKKTFEHQTPAKVQPQRQGLVSQPQSY